MPCLGSHGPVVPGRHARRGAAQPFAQRQNEVLFCSWNTELNSSKPFAQQPFKFIPLSIYSLGLHILGPRRLFRQCLVLSLQE